MTDRTKPIPAKSPWSVPLALADVPEEGRHVEIVADESIRSAIAKVANLAAVPRLAASFDLTRQGDSLHAAGRVEALVMQNCVVTLEPVESRIDEAIDLVFVPEPTSVTDSRVVAHPTVDAEDPPETLQNGTADLGMVATEFLLLGINPYPRKPGVAFDAPKAEQPGDSPFAALAALRKNDSPENR